MARTFLWIAFPFPKKCCKNNGDLREYVIDFREN